MKISNIKDPENMRDITYRGHKYVQYGNNEIEAGNSEIITISPKDKNNNYVILDDTIKSLFSAYLLSSDYEIIKASQKSFTSYLNYEVVLNNAGNYIWNAQYNKRKIKFDKNSVSVKPSSCKPENTLIYFKDKNGEYIELNTEKGNKAYSSYTSPLTNYHKTLNSTPSLQ